MRNNYVSPPLCRFLGFSGFMVGLAFFINVNNYLGLGIDMIGFSSFGYKGLILLAVSLVVSLIFMMIGWWIGFSIRIESDEFHYFIACMWHFLAWGIFIWVMLWGFFLRIKLGPQAQDMILKIVKSIGILKFSWISFNWGIAACFAAGIIGWLVQSSLPIVFIGACLSFTIGAYLQIRIYSFNSSAWIVIGIISGIATVILACMSIDKDRRERSEIKNM